MTAQTDLILIVSVLVLSGFYATWLCSTTGQQFANDYTWLAFSIGEMIIILAVAWFGQIDALRLFVLNVVGAFPMIVRDVYLKSRITHQQRLDDMYAKGEEMAEQG